MMKDIMPISGQFVMRELPYSELSGVVSAQTLGIHHGKHLKAYVDNLNKALPGSGLEGMCLTDVVRKSEGGLFNNAGQVLNHTMYFEQFSNTPHAMSNAFAARLDAAFGSEEAFHREFEQKGTTLFGSGWVWLAEDRDGRLVVTQNANADNPVCHGLKPLLTFDVWEHAYYLDYQNRRADYLASLWKAVDWSVVEERL